jgi:hypothetical protein
MSKMIGVNLPGKAAPAPWNKAPHVFGQASIGTPAAILREIALVPIFGILFIALFLDKNYNKLETDIPRCHVSHITISYMGVLNSTSLPSDKTRSKRRLSSKFIS